MAIEESKFIERRKRQEKIYKEKGKNGKIYREVNLKVEILPEEVRGEILLLRKRIKEMTADLENLNVKLADYNAIAKELGIDPDAEPTYKP